jgi:nitrate/nitrite transporter NarK
MFAFTLGWLTFEITGSQAQLGFIYLCGFVPAFALTLLGGVLADRIDARKLIRAAQTNTAIAMIMVGVTAMLAWRNYGTWRWAHFWWDCRAPSMSPRAPRFSRVCCRAHCCAPRCR